MTKSLKTELDPNVTEEFTNLTRPLCAFLQKYGGSLDRITITSNHAVWDPCRLERKVTNKN